MGHQLIRAKARNVFPLFFAGMLIKTHQNTIPMYGMYLGEVKLFGQKNKNICIFDDLSFDFVFVLWKNIINIKVELIY